MTEAAGTEPVVLYLITSQISSIFLRGQLAYLQEHGFHVELGANLDNEDGVGSFDDGVVLHHLRYVREPSPINDLVALVATVRLIRSIRPGIVNASTPKAGLIGSIAAWLCRVPKRIYVVRGLRYETACGARRAIFRATEKLAMRVSTDVIFNSRSLRKVAEDDGLIARGRGSVLGNGGNGLDTTRFENLPTRHEARATHGFLDDDYVIGFVGRLTKDKGIADLLAAYDLLLDRRHDARLLIVGSFERGDPVGEEAMERIDNDSHILHVEWMSNPGSAYKAMDVLCFPSYREGLPNVPIEAQYCGVPVVAYAVTGTVDAVLEGNGHFVPAGDAGALADCLVALAGHRPTERDGSLVDDEIAKAFDQRIVWERLRSAMT